MHHVVETILTKNAAGSVVSVAREFVELIKPRISIMVVMTVVVGGVLSFGPGSSFAALIFSAVGVALVAASGTAWNQYLERYTDFLMPRTANRPLPRQSLTATQVAIFGAVTLGIGLVCLLMLVNWLAGLLGLATWILYVWIYTPLKVRTWWNTLVGAVPGAMPILIGAVACGKVAPLAWVFFAVLFLWQFPHFMAIAWLYRRDYALGGLQMATVVDPSGRLAGWHAVLTSLALFPVSALALLWLPQRGVALAFALVAGGLNLWYLLASLRFFRAVDDRTARRLMFVSLLYLPLYMVALVAAQAWAR